MPEDTLLAVAEHASGWTPLANEAGRDHLAPFAEAAGLDIDDLARTLQERGAASFVSSWTALLDCVVQKGQPPSGIDQPA